MEKNETLCWQCENFSNCSWSRGVPVEDWDAEPTIIKQIDGHITHSFCVKSCPQFIASSKVLYSSDKIAEIIGIERRTFYRIPLKTVREKLKEKGYKLYVYHVNSRTREYYLEKIGGESESN